MVLRLPGYSEYGSFYFQLKQKAYLVSEGFPCCLLFVDLLVRWLEKKLSQPCFLKCWLHGDEFPMVESISKTSSPPQKNKSKFFPHRKIAGKTRVVSCWWQLGHFHNIPYSKDFQGWDPSFFCVFLGGRSGHRKLHGGALRFESSRVGFHNKCASECFEGENLWHLERHMAGAMVKHCFIQGE